MWGAGKSNAPPIKRFSASQVPHSPHKNLILVSAGKLSCIPANMGICRPSYANIWTLLNPTNNLHAIYYAAPIVSTAKTTIGAKSTARHYVAEQLVRIFSPSMIQDPSGHHMQIFVVRAGLSSTLFRIIDHLDLSAISPSPLHITVCIAVSTVISRDSKQHGLYPKCRRPRNPLLCAGESGTLDSEFCTQLSSQILPIGYIIVRSRILTYRVPRQYGLLL